MDKKMTNVTHICDSNLKTHINSFHYKQKYHKCDSCVKVFSQAGHLSNFHRNVYDDYTQYKFRNNRYMLDEIAL